VEIFLLGAALAFSINIELGVVNVMIVRTAIDRGAWPALLIGLGSCIGDVIWACAGALGVSALLQWPPAAWVLWMRCAAAQLMTHHHSVAPPDCVPLGSDSALPSAPPR